jgi:hypothetical protein
MPTGIHEIRLDGFKPALSKNGASINLNPILKVINTNDPELVGKDVFFNLNTNFFTGIVDFCHAFGEVLTPDGDEFTIPGTFGTEDGADPKKWPPYQGVLLGKTAKLEMAEADNGKGGTTVKVKRFFCKVPSCTTQHSDSIN